MAWVTGTAAPCTGLFKPVWMDAGLPDLGPGPKGEYDAGSLWWKHERLHRAILEDFAIRLAAIAPERDRMEAGFLQQARAVMDCTSAERLAFSAHCFDEGAAWAERWQSKVVQQPVQRRPAIYQRAAWGAFNRQAKIALAR